MFTLPFVFFAIAAEPAPEVLPMPRQIEMMLPGPIPVVEMGPMGPVKPGFFLPDQYAAIKLYAYDRENQPRPRVIFAPQSYYLYNGRPYYFLPTRPNSFSSGPQPSFP